MKIEKGSSVGSREPFPFIPCTPGAHSYSFDTTIIVDFTSWVQELDFVCLCP